MTAGITTNSLAARAEHWALTLTRIPSVTGTPDEVAYAETLAGLLRASPAFRDRPEDVWTIPTGDRLGRASVAALLRGRGTRTVVLTGHFDTVTTADYGDLLPVAIDPGPLKQALLARLGKATHGEHEKRALADLSGPDFLPGRGLLDMKGGLAVGLAVLEAAAADPDREGNLLFLAVPDEEVNSAGARSAARALPGLAGTLSLSFDAAINLDCLGDTGDGRFGRSVALGSVGKLLPSALVVGRAVHAADTIRGVSAAALAGAVAAAVEWAPELTESLGNTSGTPATLLGMKDGKPGYDVTTPGTVWMFWNTALYRRGPEDVLAPLTRLVEGAVGGVAAQLRQRGGADVPDIPVLRFDALRQEVLARSPEAAAAIAALAEEVAEAGLDLPEQCRRITEAVWRLSGRSGPAVVLGFASMPYLPVVLGEDAAARRLDRATRDAAATIAARHGTTIGLEPYFPGISDMSFLGQGDESSVGAIAADTPAWGAGLHWPEGPALAQIPIVNAGPWGRDYHTPLERLHRPYAFEVLPELIQEIVAGVLKS